MKLSILPALPSAAIFVTSGSFIPSCRGATPEEKLKTVDRFLSDFERAKSALGPNQQQDFFSRRLPSKKEARVGATSKSSKAGGGRKGGGSNDKKGKGECKEEETMEWLFVQMANECSIRRDEDGKFWIDAHEMFEETWAFTDRPVKHEMTFPTSHFVENFEEMFTDPETGKLVPPNLAITLVPDDDPDAFNGPIVAAALKAVESDEEGQAVYSYELEQSEEQRGEIALSGFFDTVSGVEEKYFSHCSYFVDVLTLLAALTAAGIAAIGAIATLLGLAIVVGGATVTVTCIFASSDVCTTALDKAKQVADEGISGAAKVIIALADKFGGQILDDIKSVIGSS